MRPFEFIDALLPGAWQIQLEYGLPAAAMIAQAAQETGWGRFITTDMYSGRSSLNLFNIKGAGPAGGVRALTFEYDSQGHRYNTVAYFRAYNGYAESFRDYAELITSKTRYAPAVATAADPREYVRQLQACGYATDPGYAEEIIWIIDYYNITGEVEIFMSEVSDWAQASWEKAVKKGVVDGTAPKGSMTREMFAVLADKLGLLDAGDVPQEIVDGLKGAGLINGDHPVGARVTWGELATVINRLKGGK